MRRARGRHRARLALVNQLCGAAWILHSLLGDANRGRSYIERMIVDDLHRDLSARIRAGIVRPMRVPGYTGAPPPGHLADPESLYGSPVRRR